MILETPDEIVRCLGTHQQLDHSQAGVSATVLNSVFASSRYFIMIAVLATFFSSVTLLVYGAIVVVDIVIDLVQDGTVSSTRAKLLAVEMIEMIDVFLLGTVLYIVSLGLHSLFIEPNLKMPEWLRVETIDDLKARIVGVVIVLLAVTFLADAVTWDSGRDIIYFGVAIAIVILALGISNYTTFLVHSKDHHDE